MTGIDLSPEMIARATDQTRGGRDGDARVSFQVADVVELPFEDGSVDLVVSSISMHHWEDPAAGLRDVVRVLRPGAEAWIYDVRPMIRRGAQAAAELDADVRVECPLSGTLWLNPIGRLILRRH